MIPLGILASATRRVMSLWTPANLAVAPKIWLDHTAPVTDVSGYASDWANRGSLGGGFSQSTFGSRPQILTAEINGYAALRFDASNDYLESTAARDYARNISRADMLFVARPRVKGGGTGCLFGLNAAGAGARARINIGYGYPGTEDAYFASSRRDATDSEAIHSAAVAAAEWSIFRVGFNFVGNRILSAVNGGAETSISAWSGSFSTTNTTSGYSARIGMYPTGGNYLDGDLAAIVGLDGSGVSSSDAQRLEGYYAHVYALQSNLPNDHPFRHVPPYVNTPVPQPSFASDPVVIGFVAATDSGNVGVAVGPAVLTEFGTLLNSEPSLSAGEGIECYSDGSVITITLTGLTPATLPARAVVIDHKGSTLATIAMSGSGPFTGTAAGSLAESGVYYVRVEGA